MSFRIMFPRVPTSFIVAFAMMVGCVEHVGAQEPQFPYEVVVADRTASIYSGPGDVHYVCDRLAIGRRLEVYRHDPDGWLAVRPPAGSFSLVPTDAVSRTGEAGIGQIRIEGTKAWVGTRLANPDRPLWQVRLRKGERVEVVGQLTAPGTDGQSIDWLRISPPAGEFRWVQARDVTRYEPAEVSSREGATAATEQLASIPDPRDGLRSPTTDTLGSAPPAMSEPNEMATPIPIEEQHPSELPSTIVRNPSNIALVGRETDATPDDDATANDQAGVPGNNDASSTNQGAPDGFVRRPSSSDEPKVLPAIDVEPQSGDQDASPNDPSANGAAAADGGWQANGDSLPIIHDDTPTFADSIRLVELELTKMASLPVEEWNTRDLAETVARLQPSASNLQEQQRLMQLRQKIDQYDSLQLRQTALANLLHNGQPIGTGVSLDDSYSDDVREAAKTYAGTGYLNRMVTQHGLGRGAYVLQDEDGKIINIVTPSPGVNLERYLAKHVALQGKKGPHARYDKPLILADRVILLDRHR